MDSKTEKFSLNNYIMYKTGNEWREGRIKSISQEDGKIIYRVISFHDYGDIILTSDDPMSISTPETRKKMKLLAFSDIPRKAHIPSRLENLLILDKEWVKTNSYDLPSRITVREVLTSFRDFQASAAGESDEINEAFLGFIEAFNLLLPRFLLYRCESDLLSTLSMPSADFFGPVYLLRLVYFLQRKGRDYIADPQTESILLEYTVYLLDFLLARQDEYF